jgi:hypothetical protein
VMGISPLVKTFRNTRMSVGCFLPNAGLRIVRRIAKSDNQLCHVCLYMCAPVRMARFGSDWRDFHENWYLSIKIRFYQNVKRMGTFVHVWS